MPAPAPTSEETPETPSILLGTLGTGIPGEEELVGIVGRAANLEKAFDTLVEKHVDYLTRKRGELDADVELSARGLDADAQTKAIVQKAAKQKADKQYNEYVRGVRTITQESRDEMLRQLHALNQRAELALKLFPTPVQLLAVAGLGSPERTTFHAQTAHAGPSELGNLANYAIASGNTILAAALMARVGHLPKGLAKPFTPGQFANAMVGERHRNLSKASRTVTATFQRFVNQNRAFETGRVSLAANIGDALRLDAINKE